MLRARQGSRSCAAPEEGNGDGIAAAAAPEGEGALAEAEPMEEDNGEEAAVIEDDVVVENAEQPNAEEAAAAPGGGRLGRAAARARGVGVADFWDVSALEHLQRERQKRNTQRESTPGCATAAHRQMC